jgi:hypothetical protein
MLLFNKFNERPKFITHTKRRVKIMDRKLFEQSIDALHNAEKALNDIAKKTGLYPDQEYARELCSETLDKYKHLMLKKLAQRINAEYAAWQEYKERSRMNNKDRER